MIDHPKADGLAFVSLIFFTGVGCALLRWYMFRESPEHRSRMEWLVILTAGACLGGFIFSGVLHGILYPPTRPAQPEPELGYTYFLHTKYGAAYGTYFEYLAVNFGVFVMWGLGALIGLTAWAYGILSGGYAARFDSFAVAAVSSGLYYAIWRAFHL
jgi:hypothetical protein